MTLDYSNKQDGSEDESGGGLGSGGDLVVRHWTVNQDVGSNPTYISVMLSLSGFTQSLIK